MVRASLWVVLLAVPAAATTYTVGPTGRMYTQLSQVTALNLMPGDVIEVDGNATYAAVAWTRSGSAAAPITLRGLKVNGVRPRLQGGANTIEVRANYVVVEGFDITGGTSRCVFQHGNQVTLRDSVVHDCPKQGVLGADQDSGSFTMEYVEVHHAGGGTFDHQIYMATDEVAFPGSVFRMRYCYVHDANGGNSVKSRAERNEIHYNWIEGALYHELELIGPDPGGAPAGWTIDLKREDSEVIGNVFRKIGTSFVARIGGDATGWSKGRYRFVNNTIVLSANSSSVFRLFDELESVEMHNNVIVRESGTMAVNVMRADPTEMSWVGGVRRISGTNNWVQTGAINTPVEWTGTVTGASPGFSAIAGLDFRLAAGSPLINAGGPATTSPTGAPFPSPLAAPVFHPPQRTLLAVGTAEARPATGVLDIGAFEVGASGTGGGSGGGAGGGSAGGAAGGSAGGAAGGSAGGAAGGSAGGAAGGSAGGVAGGSAGGAAGGSAGGGEMTTQGCGCSAGDGGMLALLAIALLPRRRKPGRFPKLS